MSIVNKPSKLLDNKLLVLTDFSDNSWMATRYAISLFEDRDCDFYFLNTYEKDTEVFSRPFVLENNRPSDPEHESKEGLGRLLVRLSQLDIPIRHRFHVISREGIIVKEAQNIAEKLAVDMIIMGVSSNPDQRKRNYSGHTLSLIENVKKIPVLIVPNNATIQRPEEIVLATNFDTDLNMSEIKYLAEIAHLSKASIKVFSSNKRHPLSPGQKAKKMLLSRGLQNVKHSFRIASDNKMENAFESLPGLRSPNMITYIESKPSFWERLGFGRKASGKLGYIKNTPVLVLQS